ncbi:PREDICTED: MAM and LDL-receptor class A domain-containing protein 2-like [Priapulus caudatus]|uniref:MAM and LDL-receptor class A domain-containing protein 2-like n=1 Tax=Priapulus caudatus TaxID=37621 RepID=A0ABM1EPD3_PRICU|nr:PREDICTED: MAM and LDL-receptor class A domain-containing protein 2-like [Priapulus caudatus]
MDPDAEVSVASVAAGLKGCYTSLMISGSLPSLVVLASLFFLCVRGDCPVDQFLCSDGNCISSTSVCNHKPDCPHGEDERNQCGTMCDFETPCDWKATNVVTRQGWSQGFELTQVGDDIDGPTKDYMPGTDKGHFMYLAYKANIQVQLISPWYGGSGPECRLSFALQMVGENTIGSLNVLLATPNVTRIIRSFTKSSSSPLRNPHSSLKPM